MVVNVDVDVNVDDVDECDAVEVDDDAGKHAKKKEWLNTKICKNGLRVLFTLHEEWEAMGTTAFAINCSSWLGSKSIWDESVMATFDRLRVLSELSFCIAKMDGNNASM